jgi:hypothetical protein
MKTFYQFLENINSSLVSIDLEDYKKQATRKAQELLDFANERRQKLSNFKLDLNLIKNNLKTYPFLSQLLIFLSKELDGEKLKNWIGSIRNYEKKTRNELEERYKKEKEEVEKLKPKYAQAYQQKLMGENPDEYYKKWHEIRTKYSNEQKEVFSIFSAIRHLGEYADSVDVGQVDDQEYYNLANEATEETNKKMLELKSKIENFINKISWNGSTVVIKPEMPESNEDPVPSTDSAQIIVGKDGYFSYFSDEEEDNPKFIIDDIIEAGEDEDDFFANEQEKQDYYSLIDILQNPNKKDEILTLYTARPVKDRKFYINTDYLPANIFLSNSFSHVDGLAGDLAGTEERRDIYKVRINSKYLIKTLDGSVKYYQVVKNAPVKSIKLY